MKTRKYSNYRKYSERWLDQLPAHWQVIKGKWLFKKEERPVRKEDDIITCFRDGQVTLRINRKTEGFTNALKEHGYQGIRKGDLVIHAMDAFAGAIGISDSDGKSTPVYSVCTPRHSDIQPYYYSYFMRNLARNGYIQALAKGIRERSTDFRFSDFGVLLLPLPPLKEQNKIIDYLDQKTAQIDKAIAQKEQIIELLKERKQILINKAVTRGLNPDIALKDSGVDWIGEIPEHWELLKIKNIGIIVNGATPSSSIPHYWDGNIVWITPIDIKNDMYIERSERLLTNRGYESCGTTLIPKGSLILTTRAPIGKVSIANSNLCTNQGCKTIVFKEEKEVNSEFIYYQLLISTEVLNSLGTGTTFMELSSKEMKNFLLTIPPLSEQQQIAEYIEANSQKINSAITQKHLEIEKLKEYKATLIDSAVTGKICLTDN